MTNEPKLCDQGWKKLGHGGFYRGIQFYFKLKLEKSGDNQLFKQENLVPTYRKSYVRVCILNMISIQKTSWTP